MNHFLLGGAEFILVLATLEEAVLCKNKHVVALKNAEVGHLYQLHPTSLI